MQSTSCTLMGFSKGHLKCRLNVPVNRGSNPTPRTNNKPPAPGLVIEHSLDFHCPSTVTLFIGRRVVVPDVDDTLPSTPALRPPNSHGLSSQRESITTLVVE